MSFTTGKVRVLIATTNGPVEIQLLTEEDAAIGRCVACIGGTTETADIASAYHAFVVRPTGVIEARFGHSCYRMDVSARIDAGSSWQLGVLAAHALLAGGRLAQENDIADGILWATGRARKLVRPPQAGAQRATPCATGDPGWQRTRSVRIRQTRDNGYRRRTCR